MVYIDRHRLLLGHLDRYLLREVALVLLATLLVLTVLVLSHRLARYLQQAASGLLADRLIIELLTLQLIRHSTVLIVLSTLIAMMLALGRLYRDSEMTALRACGHSPRQLYRPLLLIALPLILLQGWLAFEVVPWSLRLHDVLEERARQEADPSLFEPGRFRELDGGTHVVHIGALNQGEQMRDIFINSRLDHEAMAVTTARFGQLLHDSERDARYLVLRQGERYEGRLHDDAQQRAQFQRLALRLDAHIERPLLDEEAMSTTALWQQNDPRAWAELHYRLAAPLSLLLLTMLAPLLAHADPSEGRHARVFAAVLMFTIYFNVLGAGRIGLYREQIPLWWGLWWAHGLIGLVCIGLWWRHYGWSLRH